jgi:hypothetical protein
MMYTITIFISLFLSFVPNDSSECHLAYQDATYGFQHAETAMEANNIEHLKQFARRSKIAIEKVLITTEKCGCMEANNASYKTLENLNKALEKEKFETTRFFVNRAKTNAHAIIVALDICSVENPEFILLENEDSLIEQEQLLLEQQKRLMERQKKLEEQMMRQKKLKEELKIQKETMLSEQKMIKADVEVSLQQLESIILSFKRTIGCEETKSLTEEPYERTLLDLESESLQATKFFYVTKAREMVNNLLNALDDCDWKK